MKVTVCELPNCASYSDREWDELVAGVKAENTDFLLLPEMPFYGWLAGSKEVKPQLWQEAVEAHDKWLARLNEIPANIIAGVETPFLSTLVWVLAGLLSWCGAVTIAELGVLYPEAGGEYVYLEKAYHPVLGFLYGWTLFACIQTASIAAVSVVFMTYLGYFFPLSAVAVKVGAIIWDGEQIRAEPAGVREFQEIASRPYWISMPREVKELSPERDPEAWINNLHTRYSSQHIRVSKAG